MSHNSLKHINNIYNDDSHILDLVFVDHDYDTNLFLLISHLFRKTFYHSPITVEFSVLNNQPAIDNRFVFDFKNANFVGLNTVLNSFEWNDIFSNFNEF